MINKIAVKEQMKKDIEHARRKQVSMSVLKDASKELRRQETIRGFKHFIKKSKSFFTGKNIGKELNQARHSMKKRMSMIFYNKKNKSRKAKKGVELMKELKIMQDYNQKK